MVKKKMVKKSAKKKSVGVVKKTDNSNERKKKIAVRNLILFVIMFGVSILLYTFSNQEIYINLFFVLSIIFGFVAIAFLIVYLVLFFRRVMK